MLISLVVVIIALLGLLLYALAANPKAAEIGRIAFFSGLLATCFAFGGRMMKLF